MKTHATIKKIKENWEIGKSEEIKYVLQEKDINKVKFSRYRPEQALGDPEGEGFRVLRDFRHCEDGKVVTPYAPTVFTPRSILVLIFRG
jgi:hypothetical protein